MRRVVLLGVVIALLAPGLSEVAAASPGPGPLLGGGTKPASQDAAPVPSPSPAGAASAEEPARPKPIAMALVARSAEEAQERLQTIANGLLPSADERAIVADLPRREEEVRRMARTFEGEAPESLPPRILEDARQGWIRMDHDVASWERTLESAASTLQDQQAEVRALGDLWTSTYLEAEATGAPAVVVERIAGVRGRVDETEARFKERFDAILVLQDRVAGLRTRVAAGMDAADRATNAVQQTLFEVESAPLWAAVGSGKRPASIAAEIRDTWRATIADFRHFLGQEPRRFTLHLALFAVLAAGIASMRRRGSAWLATSDPSAATAEMILSRPVSSAALIAILLTFWLYVAPPASVLHVLGVLVLVPFFRVLPGLVRRSLLPPLYGLGVLWVVERCRDLVGPHSLLQRLVLLASTALALAGLAFSLRPGGPARAIDAGRWWKAALAASRLAALLLAISVVSNVVGNVTLADVLTSATLGSAFAAVLLFAAVEILEAMTAVPLRSPAVHGFRSLRERADVVQARSSAALRFCALVAWIYLTLVSFRLWPRAVAALTAVLSKRWVLGSIDISLGNVAAFVVALGLALAVGRVLRVLLDDAVLPDLGLPRGVPAAISKTVQYVIVGFGVVMAFLAAGLDMGRFGFLAGALGVGIGFGLQNIVNNFISGIILIYERPIQEGDVIEAGKVMGRVRRIGIRSSTVHTFDGAEVVVPNASLISSEVVNWTLSDRVCRAELKIGVAYGTDPRRVIDILRGLVKDRPDVLASPAPVVLFTGLGESSLDFALRFWTPDYDSLLLVKSAVLAEAYAALGEAGIEIPFPQRDLHLRSVDAGAAKALSGQGPDEG